MNVDEITAETIAEVQPHLEAAVTAVVQLWDALGSIEDLIGVEVEMSDIDHLAIMAPVDGDPPHCISAEETDRKSVV